MNAPAPKFDDVLRKMLGTSPDPHKAVKKVAKKKVTPKKKPA